MKYIRVITLLFYILICSPSQAHSENNKIQSLIDELAEAGHRDILFKQEGDTLKIVYWPIGFRDDYQGYIDLKRMIIKYIENSQKREVNFIELIQTSWGIPTVVSRIQRTNLSNKINFTKKYNSLKKTDYSSICNLSPKLMVLFDIPLSVSFGQPFDPLIFKTGIRPEIRYRLTNGILAYCQVDFYFHNEFDVHQYFKPGNIGVMVAKTFTDRIISVTNIGAFRKDLYGLNEEINVSLGDDKISVTFHGGLYGNLFFKNNKFKYGEIVHKLALLKLVYSIETYDCKLEFKGGRFLYGDKGIGFGISRVFKEIEIGFTGIRTKGDIAANIYFSIPIFPKTRKSLANYGIASVKHFKFKYWYYTNKLGREPEISTSLRNIEGLASPNHFKFMSQTFREE